MKLKFLTLSLLMVAGVNMVNAQSSTKDFVSEDSSLDKIFPFHFRNKPFTLS